MSNAIKTVSENKTVNNQKSCEEQFQNSVRKVLNRPITYEDVVRLNPTEDQIAKIITAFPDVADVDYETIKNSVEEQLMFQAEMLKATHVDINHNGEENTIALQLIFNRLVGTYVAAAYGSALFYDGRKQASLEATKLYNHARDEDRQGVDGQANRALRAREFAAKAAVRAFADQAMAEGALSAYEEIFGSAWRPYNKDKTSMDQMNEAVEREQCEALGF